MQRAFVFLVFVFLAPLTSRAQSSPEFQLPLTLADTSIDVSVTSHDTGTAPNTGTVHDTVINRDTIAIHGIAFGFDPAATVGYDAAFNEDVFFPDPPSGSFDQNYLAFQRADQSWTRVDIEPKPQQNSFAIQYTMAFGVAYFPGTIYWDPSTIPSSITGIWLQHERAPNAILDMKQASSYTLRSPDTSFTWGNKFIITVFYNMTPQKLAVAPLQSGSDLIQSVATYPNPMVSEGTLAVTLGQPAALTIRGYNVAGREVLTLTQQGNAGLNQIGLEALASMHGAIMLRLEAVSSNAHESRPIMLAKP